MGTGDTFELATAWDEKAQLEIPKSRLSIHTLIVYKSIPHTWDIFPKTFDYTYSCFERNKVELHRPRDHPQKGIWVSNT